jgi:starch phosphorylase
VHSVTWTGDALRALFDRYIPGWRSDPAMLRHAMRIPPEEVWSAHQDAKRALLETIRERTGRALSPDALTLGFARRATAYKRADLVFSDLPRLRAIASRWPLQLVFAGKSHPRDQEGKTIIRRIFATAKELGSAVPVVFLEEYDVDLARLLVSGADVWLNTPLRPLEASGTSGMKAAHNGIPSLSALDGWWLEGHIEGVTGWSIGDREPLADPAQAGRDDSEDLYRKLDGVVGPLFHGDRPRWIAVMQHAIALNASFFNTHRMVQQYALSAYR